MKYGLAGRGNSVPGHRLLGEFQPVCNPHRANPGEWGVGIASDSSVWLPLHLSSPASQDPSQGLDDP